MSKEDFEFEKALISGKANSKIAKIKKYLQFFKDVIRLVKKDDYDLIYVHYVSHSLLPLLFVRHLLILNAHGSDVLVSTKLIQKLVTPIIKKADLLVVPSEYFLKIVHKRFIIDKSKIFISPSGGIDKKIFTPLGVKKQNDIFTVGFLSRIDKGKGWDILLQSMSLLKDKKIRLLLVGSGSQEKQMLEMIEQLELQNIIELHCGQPHDKLPYFFNQMDIFVFPTTLNESLGLVGLEAMACGIPVVGSNIGGLTGYINDGKLFEVTDSQGLAEEIKYFMNLDESKMQMFSRNALNTASIYEAKKVTYELSNKIIEIGKRKL
ncbi:MAG: glycosyltransferase family 4 protein [Arcobacteraceae bacterium]|nr:glycosyltransferase family 4 protein [Arcobacteraceae bacterium]